MAHKANATRRHRIPRPKRRVLKGSEYDAALRQRGSLTVWFTAEAIEHWKAAPRSTPGGRRPRSLRPNARRAGTLVLSRV